mmetsp:Transcript_6632/g.7709  ORF Transcript_6632/g.7709 Transcript_6632/m.7709 type:complete len:528 (+) Transcript_6632:87-1670(+)
MKVAVSPAIAISIVTAVAYNVHFVDADLVKMCLFYKTSGHVRSDPILSQTCVSDHVHTFYGPQQFHPDTTNEDLRTSDPNFSTSKFVENQSLYWHPSIYRVDTDAATGEKTYELAEVSFAGPYYRWDKDAPSPTVEPFPKGFQMIAGFPVDGKVEDGVNLFSECLCPKDCTRSDGCETESDLFPADACGEMGIAMAFPTCWNETAGLGDTNDHISHMAYTLDGTVEGECPIGFGRRLPQIQLFVRIVNYEGGQYTFSDNTLPGDEEIFHADFMEGWLDGALEEIIADCESTQTEAGDYNPPCTCDQFLTPKDSLLSDDPDSFSAEAADICPIDVRIYIVDEEINGALPRGSCSATLIEKMNGVDPPFVEGCGLQYTPPTFDEENCEDQSGDSDDSDDSDDEESCMDNSDYRFRDKEKKDCEWVAEDTDKRCKKKVIKSGNVKVFEECRMTCGDCEESESESDSDEEEFDCEDDDDFDFKGKTGKDCDWVKEKIEQQGLEFCKQKAKKKKKKKIKDFCKMTCGNCGLE